MNEIILAAIGLAGIGATAFFTYLGTRGKTQSEHRTALESRVDERVAALMDADQKRIEKLENDRDELDAKVASQGETIRALTDEVASWQRRWGAVGRVFRALAAQWTGPHMPNLDPLDLAELEDTIPPQWIRR